MLNTILLASSNAGGDVYIGLAPDQLNQAYRIPAVQFVWTDYYEGEGRDYKIGTLKLTEALWTKWWGERMDDLFDWAKDWRKFAARLAKKAEYWFACPFGSCVERFEDMEQYEKHLKDHAAQMRQIEREYLGED